MRMFIVLPLVGSLLAACGGASVQVGTTPPPPAETAKAVAAPTDKDNDGVPDADDQCPDQAGSATAAKKGCPEEKKLAEVSGEDIKVNGKILFESGNAKLDAADGPILDVLAEIMKTNKDIDVVEVEGHADHMGDAKQNVTLTENRAKSVVEALVKRGVEKNRLVAKGYGEYCPVEAGDSPAAHEANRRVVFKILKHGGKATGIATGCEAAVKAGVKPVKM
jgi:OmpA-OmpF porin, OOP family